MTSPDVPTSSRRAMLAGAGAACVAALSGCATYNANTGLAGALPAQSSTASSGNGSGNGNGNGSGSAPGVLASTSAIPVGGGMILTDKKIVITQPHAGTFDAFTAVCTHQGCIVTTVSGGTINCPCHGSKFSIDNGSVVNGPATRPLAPVSIKVQGTSIIQA